MKLRGFIMASTLALPSVLTPANAEVNKYGVTVDMCGFEYDDKDFCTDKRLKNYAKVIKTRKPNFDKDKLIYIFESSNTGTGYRLVLINTQTKVVSPMMHTLSKARDSMGNLKKINSKGDNIEFDFSRDSNKFCFKGNIEAYRDSYSYEDGPFCFRYDSKFDALIREF